MTKIISRSTSTFECMLIAPCWTGQDNSIPSARFSQAFKELQNALAVEFWGFTRFAGIGAWRKPNSLKTEEEPVYCYLVAIEKSQFHRLTNIAAAFKTMAGQECVYVRHWDGTVYSVEGENWQAENAHSPKTIPSFGLVRQPQNRADREQALRTAYTTGETRLATHGERVEARARANRPWNV